MSNLAYWYCPHCKEEIDPTNVTFQELHDTCGHAVEWIEGIDLDRLRELCAAERDGRCVVLPCKVGDTVYVLPNYSAYWDDIEETKITGVSQFPTKSGVSNQIVTSIGLCYEWERDFGVRLFSTRAEAEAAMQKGE